MFAQFLFLLCPPPTHLVLFSGPEARPRGRALVREEGCAVLGRAVSDGRQRRQVLGLAGHALHALGPLRDVAPLEQEEGERKGESVYVYVGSKKTRYGIEYIIVNE